ncbi:MAG: Deoxyribodipyrimidine photo-lyase [candidate division TM6 bacterium GW2011_GWF2_33_332]|nr:MAG: Deoxyribodipyrimidine photo-lyase [candidate division TM6 bacterium GW2011_GWF2_33_332]
MISNKKYKRSIFIFHRNFRLDDNLGLLNAANLSSEIILIFIFTPNQIEKQNKFKSERATKFMIECLQDLKDQTKKIGGKIYTFYGENKKIITNLIKEEKIEAVFSNKDYTPFARNRDDQIIQLSKKLNFDFQTIDDSLLNNPE